MATVVFSADIESISSDLSTALFVDLTNYTNQGVARNTLAVVNFSYKRDANSSDTSIVIDNSNPLNATSWTFSLPSQDGEVVSLLYGFVIWSAGTYTQNQCVYYSGNYYYVNTASTSQTPGGGNWTLIPLANIPTVIAGLSPAPTNLSQTQIYNYSTAHVSTGVLASALADFGLKVVNGKPKSWSDAAGVLSGSAMINSGWTNFRKANYVVSQQIMDFLQATTTLSL